MQINKNHLLGLMCKFVATLGVTPHAAIILVLSIYYHCRYNRKPYVDKYGQQYGTIIVDHCRIILSCEREN